MEKMKLEISFDRDSMDYWQAFDKVQTLIDEGFTSGYLDGGEWSYSEPLPDSKPNIALHPSHCKCGNQVYLKAEYSTSRRVIDFKYDCSDCGHKVTGNAAAGDYTGVQTSVDLLKQLLAGENV